MVKFHDPILRLKLHRRHAKVFKLLHQTPGPNSIDGQFKHKKMSSSETWHFFWAKGGMGDSYYGVGNIMCWNVCLLFHACILIFVYFFLHMFFIYLFIYCFFCHTGWNPFFSSSLRYAGAWRRFLRQQAQWFPRWNHPRSLQKWVEAMVDDFFLFFLLNGLDKDTMMMKTNTTTVGSCEIISHDIHL